MLKPSRISRQWGRIGEDFPLVYDAKTGKTSPAPVAGAESIFRGRKQGRTEVVLLPTTFPPCRPAPDIRFYGAGPAMQMGFGAENLSRPVDEPRLSSTLDALSRKIPQATATNHVFFVERPFSTARRTGPRNMEFCVPRRPFFDVQPFVPRRAARRDRGLERRKSIRSPPPIARQQIKWYDLRHIQSELK